MKKNTKQDIIQMVEEEDVRLIRLQFTDVFGMIKTAAITKSQLERALDNKIVFDGSSIEGFVRIEESDMYLYPDLNTFRILPWRQHRGKAASFICDVYRPDGIPFEGDPRHILKTVLKRCKKMGYTFDVGPECEFFLFPQDEKGQVTTLTHEKASYFDASPLDLGESTRREIVSTLEEMGIEIEVSHHEVAPDQHEIDLRYDNALVTADNMQTARLVIKAIAKQHGLYATFMPKPVAGVDGSGMHINMALKREGKNIFYEKTNPMRLSNVCLHFIAGLLEHARGMSIITNPLVNSYKRLVPGYEAPVGIAWSENNRSPLIRIPSSRGTETRIELRSPDPAANPYLVMAVCLAAGLDGVERRLMPPGPVGNNLAHISEQERSRMNIGNLPQTLGEACLAFEQDSLMRKVLGDHISNKYLAAKRQEWQDYNRQVSAWEMKEYLYKF